jgi:outer membrane protein TolC
MIRPALLVLLAVRAAQAQQSTPSLPLTLAGAVDRAAAEAPTVAVAALRIDAARARLRQQQAGLLPTLGLGAGWLNRTFNRASLGFDFPAPPGTPPPPDLIGPFDNVDARVRVTQPLLDWASVVRVRAARAAMTTADAERSLAAENAAHAAAHAYLRAARAAALVDAGAADSTLAAELVELARAQLDAGVATPLDVTRARAQLVAAREGLALARNQLERARVELARALGLPPATPVQPVEPLSDETASTPVPLLRDQAVALALAQRPELGAETARLRAAEQGIAAVTAERLPRLELAADYGLNGRAPSEAIATRQVAVQVSVPILDGFRREGRIAEQAAARREAEIRRRESERDIAAQVEVALLDVSSAAAQQAIARERLRLAEEELAQSRERFAAGVAGNIELVNAQVSLLRARDAAIDARFAAATARAALARAAGVARELR